MAEWSKAVDLRPLNLYWSDPRGFKPHSLHTSLLFVIFHTSHLKRRFTCRLVFRPVLHVLIFHTSFEQSSNSSSIVFVYSSIISGTPLTSHLTSFCKSHLTCCFHASSRLSPTSIYPQSSHVFRTEQQFLVHPFRSPVRDYLVRPVTRNLQHFTYYSLTVPYTNLHNLVDKQHLTD
jgi:hypothetical protein